MPTLEDGDFYLFDSHAINSYLVSKYGKTDSLYPKDLQKRAIVDQRLHFDSGILFPRIGAIVVSLYMLLQYRMLEIFKKHYNPKMS